MRRFWRAGLSGNSAETLAGRDIAAGAAFAFISFAGICTVFVAPRPGQPVAVFTPSLDSAQAAAVIAAADGDLVAAGSNGIVVALGHDDGFASRLYRAGAMLVLDARAAKWCMAIAAPNGGGL